MKNAFALAFAAALMVSTSAFADTTIESATVAEPGASTSSTTIRHEDNIPAAVPVVESAPVVEKTKFKREHRGLFGKTKVKGETTTISP
jgi:hypothetical protein